MVIEIANVRFQLSLSVETAVEVLQTVKMVKTDYPVTLDL